MTKPLLDDDMGTCVQCSERNAIYPADKRVDGRWMSGGGICISCFRDALKEAMDNAQLAVERLSRASIVTSEDLRFEVQL